MKATEIANKPHPKHTMAQSTAQPGMDRLEKATDSLDGYKEPASVPEAIDPNHEEFQYLNLIKDILRDGEHRPDR